MGRRESWDGEEGREGGQGGVSSVRTGGDDGVGMATCIHCYDVFVYFSNTINSIAIYGNKGYPHLLLVFPHMFTYSRTRCAYKQKTTCIQCMCLCTHYGCPVHAVVRLVHEHITGSVFSKLQPLKSKNSFEVLITY